MSVLRTNGPLVSYGHKFCLIVLLLLLFLLDDKKVATSFQCISISRDIILNDIAMILAFTEMYVHIYCHFKLINFGLIYFISIFSNFSTFSGYLPTSVVVPFVLCFEVDFFVLFKPYVRFHSFI